MTKQEKIAEAYGEYWHIAKEFADENGWIDRFKQSCYLNIGNWGIKNPPIIKNILGLNDHGGIQTYNDKWWRPYCLNGIENNNGWIKIYSKDDLPNNETLWNDDRLNGDFVWAIRIDGFKNIISVNEITHDNHSHWKPIREENKSIY